MKSDEKNEEIGSAEWRGLERVEEGATQPLERRGRIKGDMNVEILTFFSHITYSFNRM